MVIITLILVCIIISPYIFFNYSGISESKKREKKFSEIVSNEHLNLTAQESWGNCVIGIDNVKKMMVFYRKDGDVEKINIINIAMIQSCNIEEESREFMRNKKKERMLENLNLILESATNSGLISLNFYNRDLFYYEEFEMDRAEKWKTIITENIKTIPAKQPRLVA